MKDKKKLIIVSATSAICGIAAALVAVTLVILVMKHTKLKMEKVDTSLSGSTNISSLEER